MVTVVMMVVVMVVVMVMVIVVVMAMVMVVVVVMVMVMVNYYSDKRCLVYCRTCNREEQGWRRKCRHSQPMFPTPPTSENWHQ